MRGHVSKKGKKYFVVLELGHVAAQRCGSCSKRAGWVADGKVDTCPKCGSSELRECSERRQRWLQGYDRKKDALAALAAVVAETNHSGRYLEPSRQRLGEFLVEEWLPAARAGKATGRMFRRIFG